MEEYLSKIKSWWVIIIFIGTLIVSWTNSNNRIAAVEKNQEHIMEMQRVRNLEYTYLQIDIASIKTSLEFIREKLQ